MAILQYRHANLDDLFFQYGHITILPCQFRWPVLAVWPYPSKWPVVAVRLTRQPANAVQPCLNDPLLQYIVARSYPSKQFVLEVQPCLTRWPATAVWPCPDLQWKSGVNRRTGSWHWSHDCYALCRNGRVTEKHKNINEKYRILQKLLCINWENLSKNCIS